MNYSMESQVLHKYLYDFILLLLLQQCPELVEGFENDKVVKIAMNPEGRHCMALTEKGDVYSWGSNEFGQLGHDDMKPRDVPTKIPQHLQQFEVVEIACGANHRLKFISFLK